VILVTVGTHNQPFDRLVRAMDTLAEEIDERVVIQLGVSTYQPRHSNYFDFTNSQHMVDLTAEARIIVAHAAAGAVLICLKQRKPLIVVPRLQAFKEHRDNHQLQLAKALHASGRAFALGDISLKSLRRALDRAPELDPAPYTHIALATALRSQLRIWSANYSQADEGQVESKV